MKTVNLCLLSIGLLLHAVLLIRLIRLRLLARMPVFALLVAFYIVRSLVLYGISTILDRVAYNHLFSVFSLIDIVLQVVLAVEIAFYTLRSAPSAKPGHRMRFVALVAAGAILAAIIALAAPATGRVPFDRGILFTALIMLLLLAWMTTARVSGPHRRVVEGFAVYGIVAVLAGIGRNFAFIHRSQAGFLTASYTLSGIYLLIVLYWILTIPGADGPGPRLTAGSRKLTTKN
jgi:hypothetical protein